MWGQNIPIPLECLRVPKTPRMLSTPSRLLRTLHALALARAENIEKVVASSQKMSRRLRLPASRRTWDTNRFVAYAQNLQDNVLQAARGSPLAQNFEDSPRASVTTCRKQRAPWIRQSLFPIRISSCLPEVVAWEPDGAVRAPESR